VGVCGCVWVCVGVCGCVWVCDTGCAPSMIPALSLVVVCTRERERERERVCKGSKEY